MKKFLKTLAVFAAVAALGFGFASCSGFSSDDDSGSSYDPYDFHVRNLVITQTEGKNELVFKWESDLTEKYVTTYISLFTSEDESGKSYFCIGSAEDGATTYTWDIDSFDNEYVKKTYVKEGTLTFEIRPEGKKYSSENSSYYETLHCDSLEASVQYVPVSK